MGELAEIVRGASPRPIHDPKWFDQNSDIGWLRISDVTEQNGRINYLEQKISKAGQEKTRVLYEPHLLLSIAATVGKPVINYIKTGVHDGFLIFMNPNFYQEFMFQWLEMYRPNWQKYGQPGSQINLNSELVRNQVIKIPSFEEQTRISNIFKELDKTITLHKRKIALLKQLKQGYLQDMFPQKEESVPKIRFANFDSIWEHRKFKDIGSVSMCKRIFKNQTNESGEIPFYKIGTFGKTPDAFIDRKLFSEYVENFPYPEVGDILISASGTIGRTVVYEGEEAYYQDSNIVWLKRDKGMVLSIFLEQFYQIVKWDGIEGTTIKRLYNSNILNTNISIPSIDEQNKIGFFLRNIDEIIVLQESKLEKLQSLKKAYLQKLFI